MNKLGGDIFKQLKFLAEKYENAEFIISDPSQFTRWYKERVDCEAASFVAAMLSFGSRKQFIPKIDFIFQQAGESFSEWILRGNMNSNQNRRTGGVDATSSLGGQSGGVWLKSPSGNDDDKFYRFYSYNDMNDLFGELAEILREWGSLGECVKQKWITACDKVTNPIYLDTIIANLFPKSRIVSKGKNSANKRTNMFLRWMVRGNSPVDVGLWDWYSPADLLMPLDVHVMQESIKLGLLPENAKADRKTAITLTQKMKEIWADDPCKGDFALFGLGVSDIIS